MACRNCGSGGPAQLDLDDIYRGDTYTFVIPMEDDQGNPIDIDGCSYAATIKATKDSVSFTAFSVTVDDDSSTVTLVLTPDQTEALSNKGVWDLQETCGEAVNTLMAGSVCVTTGVTA